MRCDVQKCDQNATISAEGVYGPVAQVSMLNGHTGAMSLQYNRSNFVLAIESFAYR